MANNVIRLPFALPEDVTDESFVLALDRNFKAIERALGSLQIYMNNTGYAAIYNAQTFVSQLGGLSLSFDPIDATVHQITTEESTIPEGYWAKVDFAAGVERLLYAVGRELQITAPIGTWAEVQYSVTAGVWHPVVLGTLIDLGVHITYSIKTDRDCRLTLKNSAKAFDETYLVAGFYDIVS